MTDPAVPPEHWAIVSNLLDEALLLPIEAHPQWLIDLPREHAHLKETLRSFLELHAQLDGEKYLEAGARLSKIELTPVIQASPGDLIGSYRLLEEIGVGGMGSVWLAERADGEIKRRVALKLPRLVWASDLAERMSSERDILAALEHPNIARLYDAGVDQQGRPYLAMEYVEGRRITDYCDGLCMPLRERVELFLQVITAVQYAHAQLILHRDLKPANVLVNERGEVRLLDFGIAKIMVEPATGVDDLGSTLAHPLTPKYASPEQLANQRLTLTSDVYSLGVMLYKLLTGSSPYRTRDDTRISLELAVMDGDIDAPGAALLDDDCIVRRATSRERLRRQLRGDLGAIVLKALRRNPLERYGSVEALGIDLQRWLADLPVTAVPPSRLDRARKFVLRNRWPVSVTAGAFLIVILAAAVAIWQAQQARQESLRAQATRDFLISLFDNANPELRGGNGVTAVELMGEAVELAASKLSGQPDVYQAVLESISNVWLRLGDIKKAAEALSTKSDLYRKLNQEKDLIKALLDQCGLAAQTDDLAALKSYIAEIDGISSSVKLGASERSDLFWFRGWSFLKEGKPIQAGKNFEQSLVIAKNSLSSVQKVRARYGLILSAALAGDRRKVARDFLPAIAEVKESNFDPAEKMRRDFEMVSSLAIVGEYAAGWETINDVFNQSVRLYGVSAPSQIWLQIYWMNWASRVGKTDLVLDWIKRNEMEGEGFSERPNEWKIIEGRVKARSGKTSEAQEIVARLREDLSAGPNASMQAILSLEMEISAERGDWKSLESLIENSQWHSLSEYGDIESTVLMYWYSGIRSFQEGDAKSAVNYFSRALESDQSNNHPNHPRRSVIDLARVLAIFAQDGSGINETLYAEKLKDIERDLASAYHDKHQGALLAKSLREAKNNDMVHVIKSMKKNWKLHL